MGLPGAIRSREHDTTLTVSSVKLVGDSVEDVFEGVRRVCGGEQAIRIVLKPFVVASDFVGLEDTLKPSFEDFVAGGEKFRDLHGSICLVSR